MAGNVITVEVLAEVRKMTEGIDTVNKQLGNVEKASKSASGVLKGALAADLIAGGVSAIKDGLTEAYDAVREQDRLAAQTAATLKSTGGAAGVTAGQITDLADSLEKKSLIDAEAIQNGANLMLTFTGVKNAAGEGNDVFDQSIQTMTDMATALGKDTPAAATMLGKALNDPIKGVGALAKVGVSFTDQQKDQIATMMEAGDLTGAQKVILAELNKEYGGSAQAAANADGGFKRLKDTFDGLLEEGIRLVLPAVQQLATWLADNLPGAIDQAKAALEPLTPALDAIGGALGAAFQWMTENPETVTAFATAIGVMAAAIGIVTAVQWLWNAAMTANPIGLIIVGIAALVAAIVWVTVNIDTVTAFIGDAWNSIKQWTIDTWNGIATAVSDAWNAAVKWVTDGINGIIKWITDGWTKLGELNGKAWTLLTTTISDGINKAVQFVASLPGKALSALSSLGSKIAGAATAAWNWFYNTTVATAQRAINWVLGIPGKITSGLGNLGNLLKDAGKSIIDGFLNGLKASWAAVTEFVGGIASWIADHKGPLSYDAVLLEPAGRAIMTGLTRAMRAARPALGRELAAITGQIETGLTPTMGAGVLPATTPRSALGRGTQPVINITVEAGVGSSPVEIGRQIVAAIEAYIRGGGRVAF